MKARFWFAILAALAFAAPAAAQDWPTRPVKIMIGGMTGWADEGLENLRELHFQTQSRRDG